MGKKLKIDPEFKALIPALAPDEFAALEQSILLYGCRDKLVEWNGILVDGHNRYKICTTHGKSFKTTPLERVDTREGVLYWIIENQLARRNVTDMVRGELALKKKDLIEAAAKKNQQAAGKQRAKDTTNLSKAPAINTRRELAKAAKLSEGSLAKVEKIIALAAPEVIELARQDEIKLDVAAHVATLPLDEQVALAAKGTGALKGAAKQKREKKKEASGDGPPVTPLEDERTEDPCNADSELDLLAKYRALLAENIALKERIRQLESSLDAQHFAAAHTDIDGADAAVEAVEHE